MGFKLADATNAWRMRRTRGELCRFAAVFLCVAEEIFLGVDGVVAAFNQIEE
jgi:hypothetical protein